MRGHHNIHTIRRGSNFEHGHRGLRRMVRDARENTFLTTRCEALGRKRNGGTAWGRREQKSREALPRSTPTNSLFYFFSFFFFSSAASYSLIIAIQGGHGLLIVKSGIDETRFAVTVIKPSSFHEITCRELVLPENLITAVLCTLDARIGGSRNNVIPAA